MATAPETVPAGGSGPDERSARDTPVRQGHRALVAAALTAVVAVACALALPFAPVSVNEPTVSWPQEPARPESTLLALAAYRPLALEVRFTCEVARIAAAAGGVVVSTALPSAPQAGSSSLLVTAGGGRLQVRGLDRVLLDEPLPAGPCAYAITGRSAGRPSQVGPGPGPGEPPIPDAYAFAGPANAELAVARGGRELVRTTAEQLPDVDVLVSSVTALPQAAGDLAVELRVDDEFTSRPTPVKVALVAVLVLALTATAALLLWLDRGVARPGRRARPPRLVDVVVPAVLVGWAFLAPATDDDGYFAAQARNAALSGEVGNYYQFYDQSFVPFTWPYQALSWWQQVAGLAPVVQRVPALLLGLLTWLVLRWFAASVLGSVPGRVAGIGAHATLAAAFLAWWLPYGMGVRPEPAVAFCAAAAMLAVLVAARRRRLAVAWLAFALAGAGFTAHTTGVVVLAVLLAGIPLLAPLLRVPGARAATALRVVAVGSGAMVAPLLGFADGALRDFLRGQALFLSVLDQEGWTDEFQRYAFLLAQVPMGSYARRAAVLACLAALGWFGVLAVAARLRGEALPAPLWLAGVTTALAFPALALTPSKWTHHFGALAGFGAAFLALMLVQAVPLTRRVLRGTPVPLGVLGAAAGSAVVAIALAWHGPNSWPYAWLAGVRDPGEPPSVRNVGLDGPALWALALLLVALTPVLTGRAVGARETRLVALRAVPVVVVASLVATSGYLVGTFADAAARGTPPGAIWTDPTGAGCGAAGAVRVLDPGTARPLSAVGPPGPLGGFAAGGYYPADRPQAPGEVRGSFVSRAGASPDATTGTTSTGWYALPVDGSVAVTAAGTLGGGNALTAVYGRRAGSSVVAVGEQPLTDAARAPSWRTLVLAPPAGADVVRLDAVDATVDRNGWLAFTAPAAATPVLLADHLPDGAPIALGWQLAFGYPCQRQPGVVNGVVEPPAYAVLRGTTALAGLGDLAWRPHNGGAFGHVVRSRSVLQLATVGPVDPTVQVYRLGSPLAPAAYTVTTGRRTVAGADTSVAAAGSG